MASSIANTIVDKAVSIGLNVAFLTETLGDGNCFYRSVVEALSFSEQPYYGSHENLRHEIVSYVDQNRHEDFVTLWENTILNEDLNTVISKQYQLGTYANELFIRATAIQLNIVILCTKENSSMEYPYETFWPSPFNSVGLELDSFKGLSIIIGHANSHFQSLYFIDSIPLYISCLLYTSPSPRDS